MQPLVQLVTHLLLPLESKMSMRLPSSDLQSKTRARFVYASFVVNVDCSIVQTETVWDTLRFRQVHVAFQTANRYKKVLPFIIWSDANYCSRGKIANRLTAITQNRLYLYFYIFYHVIYQVKPNKRRLQFKIYENRRSKRLQIQSSQRLISMQIFTSFSFIVCAISRK
ncbi:Hypothetical_protein [Hexamita inflata]|nr:Hypothetical protein HINF_LOCUS62028 [Hexamita inflata]